MGHGTLTCQDAYLLRLHLGAGTGIGYECIDPVQGPYAKLAGPV